MKKNKTRKKRKPIRTILYLIWPQTDNYEAGHWKLDNIISFVWSTEEHQG